MQIHQPDSVWREGTNSSIKSEEDGKKRKLLISSSCLKPWLCPWGAPGQPGQTPFSFADGTSLLWKVPSKRALEGKVPPALLRSPAGSSDADFP